jgi:hypothetical protein
MNKPIGKCPFDIAEFGTMLMDLQDGESKQK